MPYVMGSPVFQALDADGNPVSGAKLYTYEPGSSTPKPVYADSAGVTPLSYPVVCDSSGRATVYWSGTYKAILKDAEDVTLWTVDNIAEPVVAVPTVSEWIDLAYTPSYVNATQFSVAGDRRSDLHVGRRVKLTTATYGTSYGVITASAFTSVTTVTVDFDGAETMDNTLSSVAVSLVRNDHSSVGSDYTALLLRQVDDAGWRTTLGVTGSATPTWTGDGTLTLTDAGAAEGPTLDLYRDSASPAANDLLAALVLSARSSATTKRTAAKLLAKLLDATDASEDAALLVQTIVAGALGTCAMFGQGLAVGSAAVDPGAGIVNATNGFQYGATALPHQRRTAALLQPLPAASGAATFPHGLGSAPARDGLSLRYKCVDAGGEHGYAQNEYADIFTFANAGGNIYGIVVETIDATNVVARVGDAGALVMNKTTKSAGTPTLAKWNLELKVLY